MLSFLTSMNNCIAQRRWASKCISRTNIYPVQLRNTARTSTQITNARRQQTISAPGRQRDSPVQLLP